MSTPLPGQYTVKSLQAMKGKQMIMMTTANEAWDANAAQEAGYHILRIGGFFDQYDCREMIDRIKLVRAGAPKMFIDAVVPLYYPLISNEEALRLAVEAFRAGADCAYLSCTPERLAAVVKEGIPVSAHIGCNPLLSTWTGGIRGNGKTCEEAIQMYELGLAYQEAGAVYLTVEISSPEVTGEIAKRLSIPVISLGSGTTCDGSYLFSSDILGNQLMPVPRHARQYCNFHQEAIDAFKEFKADSESGAFPSEDQTVKIPEAEFEKFLAELDRRS